MVFGIRNKLNQFSNRDFVFIYIYTRFNAYRRRKEIWGIGLLRGGCIDASDARRESLYNDFHLLLFGEVRDREIGLSRPSLGLSCASFPLCIPLTSATRRYREGGRQKRYRGTETEASRRRRVRRPPPSRSRPRSPSRFLRLGGGIAPLPPTPFPLSVSVALARARQSSPEDSANRSRDDDLMLRSRILPPSNSSTLPRSFHNFDLVGEKDFLIEYRPFCRRRDFFRSVNTSELSSCFSSTLLCLRRRHARHLGDSRGVALNLLTEKRCGAYDTLIEK